MLKKSEGTAKLAGGGCSIGGFGAMMGEVTQALMGTRHVDGRLTD